MYNGLARVVVGVTVAGAAGLACARPNVRDASAPHAMFVQGSIEDEGGAPLANAIVVACDRSVLASTLAAAYMLGGMEAMLAATRSPKGNAAQECRVVETDATGTWRASVPSPRPGEDAPMLFAVAAGRTWTLLDARAPKAPIVLDVEVPVLVDLGCERELCPKTWVSLRYDPAPREQIAASLPGFDGFVTLRGLRLGTWSIAAVFRPYEAGERQASSRVTVRAGAPSKVPVHLARTGTGKSVEGRVRVRLEARAIPPLSVTVTARCGSVLRSIAAEPEGRFVLDDVGKGPCTVAVEEGSCGAPSRVEGVLEGAREIELDACFRSNEGIPSPSP